MAKFAESLCFDLADTFTGYVEFLADFLKGSGASVIKTETKAENFFFSGGKSFKNVSKLFFKKSVGSCVCRCRCETVLAIYRSAATGAPVNLPLEDASTMEFKGRF